MIRRDTTVARLLEAHPELLEVLAGYHPHFIHLRNRLLRRVMAPRVTVAQAARIAGVDPDDLLTVLRRAAGESEPGDRREHPGETASLGDAETAPDRPVALEAVPPGRRRQLDVREEIRRGEEPFAKIMGAVKALPEDEVLVLRAPFEPIPLYNVLGKRGFSHWTDRQAPDDWWVWFYREASLPRRSPEAAGPQPAPAPGDDSIRIDVRGLEPPQPMVRVLELLEALTPGQRLEVLHDRRPMFLYPQLEDRGFVHETDEPEPGLVRIVIRRGDNAS